MGCQSCICFSLSFTKLFAPVTAIIALSRAVNLGPKNVVSRQAKFNGLFNKVFAALNENESIGPETGTPIFWNPYLPRS